MESESATAQYPSKPLPNCYWVVPGRWLAGEHPGGRSALEASNRLQALLDAGVNTFIDLTETHELPPYQELLAESDVHQVRYHRLPIRDHSVPSDVRAVAALLDLIDRALADGRNIYLHCRAGIGRTGLIVGCHLVRSGLAGPAALERLQVLWRQCERSRAWPSVPETAAQVEFVRDWRESPLLDAFGGTLTLAQRCEGALVGLALGDALGWSVDSGNEVAAVLDAATELRPGADTAMTLAAAESLLQRQGHDSRDQLRRYQDWVQFAAPPLVPAELKRALGAWKWSRKAIAGSHDPRNVDPHTLARSLAAALYCVGDPEAVSELAVEVSRTTLQSPVVLDACRLWGAALLDALLGHTGEAVLSFNSPLLQQVCARKLRPPIELVVLGEWEHLVGSSAQAVLAAALRAIRGSDSFKQGMTLALSAPRQRPTCGALYGALAGALYGAAQIPAAWCARLQARRPLIDLAQRCMALAPAS